MYLLNKHLGHCCEKDEKKLYFCKLIQNNAIAGLLVYSIWAWVFIFIFFFQRRTYTIYRITKYTTGNCVNINDNGD